MHPMLLPQSHCLRCPCPSLPWFIPLPGPSFPLSSLIWRAVDQCNFCSLPCLFPACVLSHFSGVWLCVTLWTVACQVSLSMRFSRQEYWSGMPCPPPGESSQARDRTCVSYVLALHKVYGTPWLWPLAQNQLATLTDRVMAFGSAKTRPGADCGSDQELLMSKFRLKLKKVGKKL